MSFAVLACGDDASATAVTDHGSGSVGDTSSSGGPAATQTSAPSDTSVAGSSDGDGGTTASPGETTSDTTGSDSTGASAGVCDADPCGGDVVGSWAYDASLCGGPQTTAPDFCPEGTQAVYVWIEGTLEFTADGSSILHRRLVQTYHDVMPKTCLAGGSCAVYQAPWACDDTGTACDCSQSFYDDWIDETSPYTVEGTSIVIETDEGTDAVDFCAVGDELALIHVAQGEWTYLRRAPR